MKQDKVDILERAIKREKAARKAAEKILEDKSRKLYLLSEELKEANNKLEDLLGENSSTLKGVFENINDAYLAIDLLGNVLKMNEVAVNLFGYDIEKEKFNITDVIYKDDIEYSYTVFSKLYKEGFLNKYTSRILTKKKTN